MRALWMVLFAVALFGAGCSGEGTEQQAAEQEPGQSEEQAAMDQPAETPPEASQEQTQPPQRQAEPPRPTGPVVVTEMLSLQPGQQIVVALREKVSTDEDKAGATFAADIVNPVQVNAIDVFPVGSTVQGKVTYSKQAARMGGSAEMTLEFDQITDPTGKSYAIFAEPMQLKGESTASGDVQKVVGGAVGGAIIGGVIGGKSGALKGGAGGAAAGAGWAVATRGKDIVLDPGQQIQVTLKRELSVPVTYEKTSSPS